MANVIIRRGANGGLSLYLAKKDLEETIVSVEFDAADKWGGEIKLRDGHSYRVEPLPAPPRLPVTLRARRVGETQ